MRRMDMRGLFALAMLVLILLLALWGAAAPLHDPLEPDLGARLVAPGSAHWLGTDNYGRDTLSRLSAAALASLTIAVCSVAVALLCGGLIGGIAGFLGGWTDRLLSVLIDSLFAFPGMLLALALAAVLGGGMPQIILALGLSLSPAVARQLRASVLSVRERSFVEASRLLGHGRARIFLVDILPNSLTPVIVLAASLLSVALLTESALSFLGIGVSPPQPTWGNMLAEGRQFLVRAPWLVLFPGLAITGAAFAINLAGDLLRDRLDPRMRGVRA